jgi:hypothetical protein
MPRNSQSRPLAVEKSRVGVTKVVQPVVVADRVAADLVTGLLGRDILRRTPDHDGDLAFVDLHPFGFTTAASCALSTDTGLWK